MSDLQNINRQEALKINRKEANASFIKFCSLAKFYLKPWVTLVIRKSMKVKDRVQKKFLRAMDPI